MAYCGNTDANVFQEGKLRKKIVELKNKIISKTLLYVGTKKILSVLHNC